MSFLLQLTMAASFWCDTSELEVRRKCRVNLVTCVINAESIFSGVARDSAIWACFPKEELK